jgi:molybdopterin converting factor small subunit
VKVKVLYFAGARELVSKKEEPVDVKEGGSVEDLSAELLRLHPGLRKLDHSLRFSVNLEVAPKDRTLRESDVVGVLPPVAGG